MIVAAAFVAGLSVAILATFAFFRWLFGDVGA